MAFERVLETPNRYLSPDPAAVFNNPIIRRLIKKWILLDSLPSAGETPEQAGKRTWNSVTRRGRGEILIFLGLACGVIYGLREEPLLSFLSGAGEGPPRLASEDGMRPSAALAS